VTIVVARRSESGRVRVIADLRVTDCNEIRSGFPIGVLKNVICSRDVVVAFSGDVAAATYTLRQLPRPLVAAADLVPVLAESSAAHGGRLGVEYLVAATDEGIWRVRAGAVEEGLRAAWIGDKEAFTVYQRGYLERPVPPVLHAPGVSPAGPLPVSAEELEESIRMANGVLELTEYPVPSVGEAFVTASSTRDGLRYEQQAFLAADHEQVITPEQGWVNADWGTVANGGFGFSLLVPDEPGVGLYFPHPALGLLYHPLAHGEPFVYRGVTDAEFRASVLGDHGVSVSGPVLGRG
jgi:hypothetical protein